MTFKTLQIIIEIYDGLIKKCKVFDYMYFILFFPTLLSGPIDRSRRFDEDLYHPMPKEEYLEVAGAGFIRLTLGITYKFVFASAFYQGITYIGNGHYWFSNIVYMYCYGLYLFFDFAGYGHMACGASHIFGIMTPRAFNVPFRSIDIREFWDRWNITLSHWLRDFVFSRFMMASFRYHWFSSKLVGACIGLMLNMLIMGAWHGLNWSYILYGAYHGVLLCANEVYQKKSKFYKKNKKKRWYRITSWFITFNLVMFGFFIFSGKFLTLF
jgi:membrane protein involved in D-alanine export